MIKPIRLSDLQKIYENETPEEKQKRLEENQARLERWCSEWKAFREKHPDIADRMVCAA